MFPAGAPGVAILLLRFAAAISLIDLAIVHLSEPGLTDAVPLAPCLIGAAAALPLLAGFWTPIAGAAMAASQCWIALAGVHRRLFPSDSLLAHFLLAALGASLALLGPGAWSVDARLFGRKLLAHENRSRVRRLFT